MILAVLVGLAAVAYILVGASVFAAFERTVSLFDGTQEPADVVYAGMFALVWPALVVMGSGVVFFWALGKVALLAVRLYGRAR